jgi:hypothetical protein
MPRPTLTPDARVQNVNLASHDLPGALTRAMDATDAFGHGSPEALRAWEVVENLGATVHRQARILAGKSRGG